MKYDPARALELLRIGSGISDAAFRDGQEEAIRHVVEGHGRILVVQKTGWGKSFVYFIATKLLREGGAGPTLLVSPLLALMRNQILAATRMGVEAVTINSENQDDWERVEGQLAEGEVDILLISPERFANEEFRDQVLPEISGQVALMVIDEAHCISDWGHDFRPHYRLIERIARTLPPNLRLLATTATANDRVMDDLSEVLGPRLEILRGDLHRPSLTLQTIQMPKQIERLAWLAEQVPSLPGHGIIYTLTKRDARRVAEWLRLQGVDVEAYTGDSGDRRPELEVALLQNRLKALVATTALGMGFDKPDLGFVIHYQTPGSVVAYYQQVGRAGRALDAAYGILLAGEEDEEISEFFISRAFPTRHEVESIIEALEDEPDGLSVPQLLQRLNISQGRITKALALLSLENPSPVVKEGTKWQLTAAELGESFWERAERLTELRRVEQREMQQYVDLESGHMAFLIRALDGDDEAVHDGPLPPLPTTVSPQMAREAASFLRNAGLTLAPRKQWPSGGLPEFGVSGRIPKDMHAEEARALCAWGDPGWGTLVSDGKYRDGRFADELIAGCCDLLDAWDPHPSPDWVTCIPSLRHPDLVPDFAERLASALGLPFQPMLECVEVRPEQKTMANSAQQARNIDGAFRVLDAEMPEGPALLVDDITDSRWTMTIGAWLLRKAGCEAVWPLSLAYAGYGE